MYQKVSTDMKFVDREKEVLDFWNTHDIFLKSVEEKKNGPTYMFYDGPPTANGKPHIGHVLTRVIKDMIPRYHTMKGEQVLRKAGWDTHGLPVELEVERELGLDGKEQIEEYGVEPFIKRCKESVWRYKGMWEEFSDAVGFWADMEHPYITYENDYIESCWWSLKQIFDRGLLYKGFRIVPYCPRCGTPLSSHEIAQGYKDVKDTSCIAKFKIKGDDAMILAWTTTPWTLPSNVALCVNEKETYLRVRCGDTARFPGEKYILAEALADKVLGEGTYEVLERFPGEMLKGTEYEPLFDFTKADDGRLHIVVCDDYVTMEDGTGIVHIAPAFGEDDARVGRAYDLAFIQFVDAKGCMTKETPWAGKTVKETDPLVIEALRENGKLYAAIPFEHNYPHCWRCDTPLIYYARESWFIRMTAVKDELVANNKTVNWTPPSIGEGRFGDWLENIQDWNISRDRYWGTPLPVWQCSCGHRHAIGSIAELKEMSDNCPDEIELHKPYVDAVTLRCPKCGGEMHRTPEVIDCWYDSGAMPFAQFHYPFENKELFESHFPAQFISEAVDQTRGWFYSLMAVSTLIFHKAPYENVIVLGHVLDKDGQKMSKSKGNAVDPMEALGKYGADAIRWYFYTNSAPWLPNRFHGDAVTEVQKKFMGTLWNTYAFFVLYANIDEFDPTKYALEPEKLSVMDRWLLSRMNSMVKDVDRNLADYRIPEAAKAISSFVDDMSNWYVRRCRDRFWAKGMEQDKVNAYMSLYTALVTAAKVSAPMIPFMAESIYRNLVCSVDASAPESVHLCAFPETDEAMIDAGLEQKMDEVLKVVTMGRAARNTANRKNRQPLAKMFVKAPEKLPEFYQDIIREELNVKEVEFTDEVGAFTSYSFKPQMRTLGPKYGKLLGGIKAALAGIDGNAAMAELNETGLLKLDIDGNAVELAPDDLLIDTQKVEGFEAVTEKDITVVIDTRLTPELEEEGLVRETVSKIQTMRRDAGFEVTDHIAVSISGNEAIEELVRANEAKIAGDVLADSIVFGEAFEISKEWNLNGQKVTIGVRR
ncbi:MAG: isoleucine--tRNA ligase [Lachnospiraceae bacterium]|nr:isoleucine--tRNA ligase [Lachnospiraceae bacterium]